MLIRDDRRANRGAETLTVFDGPPDRVLYDCPDCKRSHFVTVDGCPSAAVAAAETAAVGGLKAKAVA